MLRFDTVTDVDPAGGRYAAATAGQAAVTSGDWFFDGHFRTIRCMRALMFEAACRPWSSTWPHSGSRLTGTVALRARGGSRAWCAAATRSARPAARSYEVFVSAPRWILPTLYADVLGTVDGVQAFHARRAAVRLVPDWPLDHWRRSGRPGSKWRQLVPPARAGRPGWPGETPRRTAEDGARDAPVAAWCGRTAGSGRRVQQDFAALLACAWGRPTQAFGAELRTVRWPRASAPPGPPITS
jgi:hypothetical protein